VAVAWTATSAARASSRVRAPISGSDSLSRNRRQTSDPGTVYIHGKVVSMPLRDTTPAAQALQASIHRGQTPAQRLRSAIEMSDFTHNLALAGVKRRNPACTEMQATYLLAEILYARKRKRS